MRVKKVFDTGPKILVPKPKYVKPVHKTYRQLLELDKPKRVIKVESDDQNDDFLQKLLKQQEKKQKQKEQSIKQKQHSKGSAHKTSKNNSRPSSPSKKTNTQNTHRSNKSKQLIKTSRHDAQDIQPYLSKKLQTQSKSLEKENNTNGKEFREGTASSKFTHNSVVKIRRKFSERQLRTKYQPISQRKSIFIDDQNYNTVRFSVDNVSSPVQYCMTSSSKIKKNQGLIKLQRKVHNDKYKLRQKAQSADWNVIETIQNPQKYSVNYNILSPVKIKRNQQQDKRVNYSQKMQDVIWKNAMSDPIRLMRITLDIKKQQRSKKFNLTEVKKTNKDDLFKSQYQESIFLQSLQKC